MYYLWRGPKYINFVRNMEIFSRYQPFRTNYRGANSRECTVQGYNVQINESELELALARMRKVRSSKNSRTEIYIRVLQRFIDRSRDKNRE